MSKKKCLDFAVYLAVRLVMTIVQAVRMETLIRFSRVISWLMVDVIKMRRKLLRENLRHAFPKLSEVARDQILREHWRYLFVMICEIAHAPRKIHETNWRQHFSLRNARPLLAALIDDRPTVVVTGHFGNFEIAGFSIGLLGFRSFSIARPLDNPYVDKFLNDFRSSTRRVVLPKQGSANDVAERLANKEILTIVGDQSAGSKGCWVEFFNRPASAHKAIAVFSLANDGPMVVSYGQQLPGEMQFEIGTEGIADPRDDTPEVAGVREMTQWYTDRLEGFIARAPAQYWWIHNRWKGWEKGRVRKPKKRAA